MEWASVFVTVDPACFDKNPWKNPPNLHAAKPPLDGIELATGWSRLSADSSVALPSGVKVELVLANCGDSRWSSTSPPVTKVTPGRILIDLAMQRDKSPHEKDYMPSLWQGRVRLEKLAKGTYDVYLHSKLAGKISVP
jgi:hypothetical protein